MSSKRFVFALTALGAASAILVPAVGRADDQRQAAPTGIRQQAEDLAKAASEEFSDLLAPQQKQQSKGGAPAGAADAKPEGETAPGSAIDTALAPVWDWLARSAKTYDGVVVAQLRSGDNWNVVLARNGIATGSIVAAATAAAPHTANARDAESPEPHGWGGLVETVRDWLARANRSYRNEIVRPLRELPSGTPSDVAQPEEKPALAVSRADVSASPAAGVDAKASGDQPPMAIETPKALVADAASRRRAEKELKARREQQTAELIAQTRLAKESEARRLAAVEAKNRIAREVEAQRIAAAEAAEAQRQAAEKARQAAEAEKLRLAAEAEAQAKRQLEEQRIARATNLAKASEARRLAEIETKAQAAREAEQQRMAEQAEAERAAEAARMEAEARRLLMVAAEEEAQAKREEEARRIAKAAEAARELETRRLAEVAENAQAARAAEAKRLAEQQRLAAEEALARARQQAEANRKAEQARQAAAEAEARRKAAAEAEASSRRAAEEAAERAAVAAAETEAKRQAEIQAEADRNIAAARAKADAAREQEAQRVALAEADRARAAAERTEAANPQGVMPAGVRPPAAAKTGAADASEAAIPSYTAPVAPALPTASKGGVDLSPVPPASELARSGVPAGAPVVMEHSSIATEPKVAVNSQGGGVAGRASANAKVAVPEKKARADTPVAPEKKPAAAGGSDAKRVAAPSRKPAVADTAAPVPTQKPVLTQKTTKQPARSSRSAAQEAPERKPAPPATDVEVLKARKEVVTAEVVPPVAKKKRKRVSAYATGGSARKKAYAVRKSGRKIARVHHRKTAKRAYRYRQHRAASAAPRHVRAARRLKPVYRVRRCACLCGTAAPRKYRASARAHYAGPRVVKMERRHVRKAPIKHKRLRVGYRKHRG